ncbi:mannitol dehydrogenase family protein [Rhizosaccharibacter radicis]|uniref:Mannitol dehydrogenase family protein n=1 Tax=Rhizosaccharibacter radicis TaxID=2782605 RepID=A0ABT1VVL9_9PROT|nr:mannitol dehydrogenase family protein [Acetobacteraceae bacterium KSS12]
MAEIELNRETLSRLPDRIRRPGFDREAASGGIVHLGLGGFHRAHMARYTQEVMEARPDMLGWGIVGAGLLPADRRMADALQPQDGLYSLVERQDRDENVSIIGSILEVIFAGETSESLLDAIDRDSVRIVSLTVTEHGYCLNRSTKKLDPEHKQIVADLADPRRPHSAPALLVEAFRRRRDAERTPFTALSCDNIQHNGNVLRAAVLAFARLREERTGETGLHDWIEQNGLFPNTMVDRITPVTHPEDSAYLARAYGLRDNWPVFCERFTQWVIEDRFSDGRPAWEDVGAQFVDDVTPYEFMKLRLLNGSHLAIAALGRLAGYRYIDETLRNPVIARYMAALMDRETGPTLSPVPGIDLGDYKRTLIERFANEGIKDTVERVNTDAPLNVLVDPIRDRLQLPPPAGGSIDLLALGLAAWMRRIRGEDESGAAIEIRHPLADELRAKAIEGGPDPRPLLSIRGLFGELGENETLVASLSHWLSSLYDVGSLRTLDRAAAELGF